MGLLQRGEAGRAVRTFLELLEATGKNAPLVEAIRKAHRIRSAQGSPRLLLPDGSDLKVFASHRGHLLLLCEIAFIFHPLGFAWFLLRGVPRAHSAPLPLKLTLLLQLMRCHCCS